MPSHSSTRISKVSVLAMAPCARCLRLGCICRVSPGYRVCDACVEAKRPCASRQSASSTSPRLRARVAVIRSELVQILRALDASDFLDFSESIEPVDPSVTGRRSVSIRSLTF